MAEAFVMLGGHHHVLLTGGLREFGPIAGGKRLGFELFGELLVFLNRKALLFHSPFVASVDAIQAPVDKHPEAGLVPPLHAPGACGILVNLHRSEARRGRKYLCARGSKAERLTASEVRHI